MNAQWFLAAAEVRERIPPFFLLWAGAAPWLLFPDRSPALALLFALALLSALLWLYRQGRLLPTAFDRPLLIYFGLSAVALLLSPLPADSLRRMTTLFLGLSGYYGLVSYLAHHGGGRAVTATVRMLPVLGAGVALAGLLAVRWPARFLLDVQFVTARLPHLCGDFTMHHNPLAGALVLLGLPGIFAWRRAPSRGGRQLLAVALGLVLLALALTQSRNALLSLIVGLAGGLLWQRGRFRWLVVLYAILLVVPLVLGLLPGTAHQSLYASLGWLDGSSKGGPATDQSWPARLEMWRAALHLLRDYPALGAGLFQFEAVSRANEVYPSIRPDLSFSHAHNLWLQSGAGLGWPGWLAAALLWLAVLYHLGRATEAASPHVRWAGSALGAALVGYLTFNTFDLLALEQRAGLLVWLLLALIAAFVHAYTPVPAGSLWRCLPLAPLALLLCLLPWLPRNLAHLQMDRVRLADGPYSLPAATALARAALAREDYRRLGLLHALQGQEEAALEVWQQDPQAVLFLEGQGLRAFFQQQDAEEALVWYARALALDPSAATVVYWQGQAYEQLGQDQAALASFRQAVVHGERDALFGRNVAGLAWERQGGLLVEQEAWEEARAAFAAAVALDPTVDYYRQQLGSVEKVLQSRGKPPSMQVTK